MVMHTYVFTKQECIRPPHQRKKIKRDTKIIHQKNFYYIGESRFRSRGLFLFYNCVSYFLRYTQ